MAALAWSANMAALEVHAPMARGDDIDSPTMCVFDLDPGPRTGIPECAEVALDIRQVLDNLAGLECLAKTSGSKGLQVYVPLNTQHTHEQCSEFAQAVAQVLEKHHPKRVTSTMAKAARPGKVFIDWSQNSRHKTTVAVYSLRARPRPTVSTPVTWDGGRGGRERGRPHLRGWRRARAGGGARRPLRRDARGAAEAPEAQPLRPPDVADTDRAGSGPGDREYSFRLNRDPGEVLRDPAVAGRVDPDDPPVAAADQPSIVRQPAGREGQVAQRASLRWFCRPARRA